MKDAIEAAAEDYAENNCAEVFHDCAINAFQVGASFGDSHGFKRAMESAEIKGLVEAALVMVTDPGPDHLTRIKGIVDALNAFKAKGGG